MVLWDERRMLMKVREEHLTGSLLGNKLSVGNEGVLKASISLNIQNKLTTIVF